jgi:hypothetical protein
LASANNHSLAQTRLEIMSGQQASEKLLPGIS